MELNKPKPNIARYITFKGIHVAANSTYYLCDFYFQKNEQSNNVYCVRIENQKSEKSEHLFELNTVLKHWECRNPDDLPCELIEKIIEVLIKL